MSIDRISTSNQSAYLAAQLMKSETRVSTLAEQLASGQVSSSYADYGNKAEAMESARAVVNRTTAYQGATKLAVAQTNLQNSQLDQLSSLTSDLKNAVAHAISTGDGTTLMSTVQDVFSQASAILNYKDSNGSYVYGGGNDSAPPFAATQLSGLAAPATVAAQFKGGDAIKSVQVTDGSSIDIGIKSSDIGTGLMQTIKDIVDYVNANGSFGPTITQSQETFLSGEVASATSAYKTINQVEAVNGNTYKRLQTAADTQSTQLDLYKGFVSDIQDVDMTTAATDLSTAQTALQVVAKVTASINQVSLLDYLPTN
jgi:flagellin-like hook-associated protein FlgL